MIFLNIKSDILDATVSDIKKLGHEIVSISPVRKDGTHLVTVLPGGPE